MNKNAGLSRNSASKSFARLDNVQNVCISEIAERRRPSAGHSGRSMQVGVLYSPRRVQSETQHFVLFATEMSASTLPKDKEVIMEPILSTGQVGRILGIQPYRIAYAINTGQIAEASFAFLGKRCFTMSDVERTAKHFGVEEVEFVKSGVERDAG